MKRLTLFICALAATMAFAAPSALAGVCNSTVSDEAGILSESQEQQVLVAAQNVEHAIGAEVHVQVVKAVNGDIDTYANNELHSCQSFADTQGGVRSNIMLELLGMNHKIGFYSGDRFGPAIHEDYPDMIADVGTYFRDGDFTGGLIEGLKDMQQSVLDAKKAKEHPGTTVINKKPADLTWLWILLSVVVGTGLVVLAGFGLLTVNRKRKAREAAQAAALKLRDTVANAVVALSQADDDMKHALEIVKLNVGADEKAELDGLESASDAAVGKATQGWQDLDHPETNPEHKHDTAQYQAITAQLEQVQQDTADAQAAIAACQQKADELTKLYNQVPGQIEKVGQAIEAAKAPVADAQKAGFKTKKADDLLVEAAAEKAKAEKAIAAKSAEKASASVAKADKCVSDALAWLKALPQTKSSLDKQSEAVQKGIDAATAHVDETRPVFDSMHNDYAESCWEPIHGNGSQAESLIEQAKALHAEATKAASMDEQRWDDAQAAVDQANKALQTAGQLCDAITALKGALDQAKAHCSQDVASASEEIDKAEAFVKENDEDLPEELETELQEARKLVSAATAELKKQKPDYLVAQKQAATAHQTADKVLEDARDDKAQMDSLRAQVQREASSAQTKVQQAASFIASHRSDVNGSAESMLSQAQSALQEADAYQVQIRSDATADADQSDGYSKQIGLYQDAENEADQAYSQARRDVQDAEDERRRQREEEERRRQASYTSISSSSSMSIGGGGGVSGGGGGWSGGGGVSGGGGGW